MEHFFLLPFDACHIWCLPFDLCTHSRMHLCLVQQFVASLSVRITGWQLQEGLILPVLTQHTLFTYRHTHTQTAKPKQFTHSLPLYIHKRSQTLEGVAQASVSVVLMGRTTSGAYTMRRYLCQSSSTRVTKTPVFPCKPISERGDHASPPRLLDQGGFVQKPQILPS